MSSNLLATMGQLLNLPRISRELSKFNRRDTEPTAYSGVIPENHSGETSCFLVL